MKSETLLINSKKTVSIKAESVNCDTIYCARLKIAEEKGRKKWGF